MRIATNSASYFQQVTSGVAFIIIIGLFAYFYQISLKQAGLFLIGIGLGVTLLHATFGFTGAYTRAILEKDISGISAQIVMLAIAMLLFAPILARGEVFGHGVGGAVAPVGVSMALGAFVFGIGMQLGGSCASGTLFTAGGGNLRMILVLFFFCAGAFWGSLDLHWWSQLPRMRSISLSKEFGWQIAIPMQFGILVLIYFGLRLFGARNQRSLWWGEPFEKKFSIQSLLQGPWPLLLGACLLALLNWGTLLIAGHPWSITWAFSLWGAKTAMMFGWEPASSSFWSGGFQKVALARSILGDTTSIMNIGIMLGAFLAASLAGRFLPKTKLSPLPLIAAVIGGLMMGYGARLSYGCNIGAFFSGVASTSLHGWVWILCAIPGNIIGIRLKPLFQLG